MSIFGLWARRCNRWLLGILAVMVAVELGLFYWAMVRYPSGDLEQIMTDSCISLAAETAFMVLSGVLLVMGRDRQVKSGYTLRRLGVTAGRGFFLHAACNTLCYFILWGVQLATALGLCLLWKRANPALWENQTMLLAFYRVPFLHGLLPLGDWYVYLRNVLWFAMMGCVTANETVSPFLLSFFLLATGIYFPRKMGDGVGWVIFQIVAALLILIGAYVRYRKAGKEAEDDGEPA